MAARRFVYTAPPSPAVSSDSFLVVDVVVTPYGNDYSNSNPRSAAIRLVPQGTVIPPAAIWSRTSRSAPPRWPITRRCSSTRRPAAARIASYEWSFGDGERDTGRTVDHDYESPGTYVVRLTIVDPYGRTASKSQSITVTASTQQPTAVFIFSPTAPRVGQGVNFNAAQSRAPAGATIVSYSWNFGDGTAVRVTGDSATTKAYGAAGLIR